MSEMVERVARAIHAAEYDIDTYPLDREHEQTQKMVRAQARAAIEAMRNHKWYGATITDCEINEAEGCTVVLAATSQTKLWQAMIDEALR